MGKVVKMKKRTELEETIESFIEHFDFDKVHQVMTQLDWKWLSHPPYGVPSISNMKYSVRHYMNECAQGAFEKLQSRPGKKKASYETGTGGFHYRAWVYRDDPKVYFEVLFAVTDWNNFD